MTDIVFPGGLVRIDTEAVWVALQRWLDGSTSRRCCVCHDSQGYVCRLTWDDAMGQPGGTAARSRLGIADAVANALQVAVATDGG